MCSYSCMSDGWFYFIQRERKCQLSASVIGAYHTCWQLAFVSNVEEVYLSRGVSHRLANFNEHRADGSGLRVVESIVLCSSRGYTFMKDFGTPALTVLCLVSKCECRACQAHKNTDLNKWKALCSHMWQKASTRNKTHNSNWFCENQFWKIIRTQCLRLRIWKVFSIVRIFNATPHTNYNDITKTARKIVLLG